MGGEDGEDTEVHVREMKESVCRHSGMRMVEKCQAEAPLMTKVAWRVDEGVECHHGLWNWLHWRNAALVSNNKQFALG